MNRHNSLACAVAFLGNRTGFLRSPGPMAYTIPGAAGVTIEVVEPTGYAAVDRQANVDWSGVLRAQYAGARANLGPGRWQSLGGDL